MLDRFDFAFETKSVDDVGVFEGYASTFGNVDQGGDVVEPGAFIESIVQAKKVGRVIPMLWDHNPGQPIGIWNDMVEDTKGLFVRGELLIDDDPIARRTHKMMKRKGLGGMSIGFAIPTGGAAMDDRRPGVRRLKKVDLREISLVTMPMNIQARPTSVKSILDGGRMPTVREFEGFLREAGFSKSLAAAIAVKATPHLRGEPEAKADDALAFLQAMRS